MYRVVIEALFYLIFLLSCQPAEQEEQVLVGNWYPYKDTSIKLEDMTYKEQYINRGDYYFYQTILSTPYKYFIKKKKLCFVYFYGKDSICLGNISFLNKNTLKVRYENSKHYFFLKRVIDSNTLEDFVTQKIDEGVYYDSFLKRETYWKKYGVLPEDGDFENSPKCKE